MESLPRRNAERLAAKHPFKGWNDGGKAALPTHKLLRNRKAIDADWIAKDRVFTHSKIMDYDIGKQIAEAITNFLAAYGLLNLVGLWPPGKKR